MDIMLLSLGLATTAMVLAILAFGISRRTAKDKSGDTSGQGY